ncbi:glycosyltransferase [Segnochrobactrum spirostomi]|nr:glycosyltransferase [Segnochrobactrum spirostomi]
MNITLAVTVYRSPSPVLAALLDSVTVAAMRLEAERPGSRLMLVIVDNSDGGTDRTRLAALVAERPTLTARLISGQGNVGFGRANNLALLPSDDDILIVGNPDLVLAPDSLVRLLDVFEAEPTAGLVTPGFVEHGRLTHLCKRYPSFVVLFGRGFLPARLRRPLAALIDRYTMADRPADRPFWDPPIVTGAFMAFRGQVFRSIGGFDERFFLYFEDFDLSLRVAAVSRLYYAPSVRMEHAGGNTARRGLKLIRFFAASAARFWGKHGFRLVAVRDRPPRAS